MIPNNEKYLNWIKENGGMLNKIKLVEYSADVILKFKYFNLE